MTMRRLLAFLGGVLSGGAIGTAVALLFTPRSGDSMRQGVRSR
ncbi:MAG: YtxH domain-containing protein, partial [Anaerolineae bacterium]|nr:YtxH domain-containing protein [Anaerolineae bacterium]